jgi:NAD(P)-dependent dehydrogenase (short-subunit alcohol dehydrogenase family)
MESVGCDVDIVKGDLLALGSGSCERPTHIWHVATVYRDMVFADMTEEAWDAVVATKVDGKFRLCRFDFADHQQTHTPSIFDRL